jgi:hypothetical protein
MTRAMVSIAAALAAALLAAGAARADAPANVFAGAGVFVDNLGNFPGPWTLADELQQAHFTWIAFHAHNGIYVSNPVNEQWVQVMREHGIAVGIWGWEDANPWLAAQLAVFETRMWGADFYIADAEWDYLRERHTAGWYRSQTFTSTFRQYAPTLPAALTTFGAATAPWVMPLDYAAWRNHGFDLLPQAYYNQFPAVDRPDQTVAHAKRAGWSVDRVHPVIGVYHNYDAGRYVPLLEQAGTTGYSVFVADQAKPSDFRSLSVLNGG